MYAIVDIAGQQYKVEKEQKVFVHRLENEIGSSVVFEKVLMIDDNGQIKIGKPILKDAGVSATVLDHLRGDKVLVFHKKRRKGYKKLNGHRQYFSQVIIHDISEDKSNLKITEFKQEPKIEVKETVKVEKKVKVKKVVEEPKAVKKAPAKKVAAKASTKKVEAPAKKAEKKPAAKTTTRKSTKTKKEE